MNGLMRCSEPGRSVAVAIRVSRAPGRCAWVVSRNRNEPSADQAADNLATCSVLRRRSTCQRSYWVCWFSQLSALVPKASDRRTAISGLIPARLFRMPDKVLRLSHRYSEHVRTSFAENFAVAEGTFRYASNAHSSSRCPGRIRRVHRRPLRLVEENAREAFAPLLGTRSGGRRRHRFLPARRRSRPSIGRRGRALLTGPAHEAQSISVIRIRRTGGRAAPAVKRSRRARGTSSTRRWRR